MATELGTILKHTRQSQRLTQKQLADGICSQSMLSAIEQNQYTPNAQLLIALCQRLNISLDEISLLNNFEISGTAEFNQKLDKLCNAHQYQQLYDFLQEPAVLDRIENDAQMQAYYYYLAVAEWHIDSKPIRAGKDFQMSLANANHNHLSTLTRLGMVSSGLIKAQADQRQAAAKWLEQATDELDIAKYEENLNVIFYLAGMIEFELNQWSAATKWVLDGIDFATEHDSHYMLANFYHLLARVAEIEEQLDLRDEARQREKVFAELFKEEPYDQF